MNTLIQAIKEDEKVKEYCQLHHIINSDKTLKQALLNLQDLQQQLINLNHVSKYEMAKVIEKEYQEKRKQLEENPIVLHYLTLQAEIKDLFEEIKDILETGLTIDL